jgi:uncharacterized protein (TIGR00255 family)
LRLLAKALLEVTRMRRREGAHLSKWFRGRIRRLHQLVKILQREGEKLPEVVSASNLPEGESSAAYSQKGDVTEEVVRLKSHLHQLERAIRSKETVGRKLDFLAQEMIREINTLGSKIQSIQAVGPVIDFKSEMEKIREQIQNVE